jgi:4-hydroxy-tetrahydrodipicolinate synthase
MGHTQKTLLFCIQVTITVPNSLFVPNPRDTKMIRGLIAPILSPFNDDLSFDQNSYNELAKTLLRSGCAGLAPFGTTGEALSISVEERKQALDGLIASGIDPSALIPGTGLCNLGESVALSQHATDLGCEGVMVLPPFYFKGVSDDGLFSYYEELIARVNRDNLRIYLYHIPQVSGVGLSIDLVNTLKEKYPSIIVGIKDSSGDWENTKNLLSIDNLVVYPGSELPLIDAMKLGAPGCISATANLNSQPIAEVIRHCEDENWDKASALHNPVAQTRIVFQNYAPIPAQKALLSQMTNRDSWRNVRPPLVALTKEKTKQLQDALDAVVTAG